MTRFSRLLCVVTATVMVGACGGEEDTTERADLESLADKADIPTWLVEVAATWGCEQTVSGKFKGYDSAHMYRLAASAGTLYELSFKGTYAASKGAVIAVYDSDTGKRVAYSKKSSSNAASLKYTAARTAEYLVAVYSVAVYATGSYTLSAHCTVSACKTNSDCAAADYCQFDAGCGKTPGTCKARPDTSTMKLQYVPVCGCDGKTYGHELLAFAAGVSVDYAGVCKPKVSVKVTVDKAAYKIGDPIAATVSNASSVSIFLPGCSVFTWQQQQSGAWVDKGPDVVCAWEGIAKEVKAGASYKATLADRGAGTFRLHVGYSVGCTAGKPLSQAKCTSTGSVSSPSFVVKSCPQLSPPAPSFCPTGKVVPKYDTDKVCITGYSCVACQVADCGPQLGMPNTLCPDGKTTAGPTGNCIGQGSGTCGWEVIECPQVVCKATGCSGQICSDQDVVTTCEWYPWYECYQKSECGAFGAGGGCGWKQTADFVACMKSYGK